LLDSLLQERFLPALRRRGPSFSRSGGHIGFVGYTLVWSNPILTNHTYTEGCTLPHKHVGPPPGHNQLSAGQVQHLGEVTLTPHTAQLGLALDRYGDSRSESELK